MPTYILHGGAALRRCESNTQFYQHIARKMQAGQTLLLVYFAADREDWARKLAHDSRNLLAQLDMKIEVAEVETFESQLQNADVVYIRDGYTDKLFKAFEAFDPKLLMQDKVYVASSAGANLLCKGCYSAPAQKVMQGLGVLPLNVLIHANKDEYSKAKEKLVKLSNQDTPFLALEETKFITLEF
ncbi:MAG: Type 1 glutamine amidotransferase-like domain-containing protein [Pseudomonadota bacterium]|nr:Type 1 glutamine amidotransferase-like domain-containing protein [Pseudomonadota bacterium]